MVGIDNSLHRAAEYNPYDDSKAGKGEGGLCLAFIVNVLKPYIDSVYRTKKGPAA